eukprot:TRINITY_DN10482_c0_g1_i3.p2 TRINITY_DN10482_c0_g1~~TRINITY_DN10482_c0_g1_i3.p2  ORF type:complete len:179 (-),score=36.15 TRINITY_DN10482_c0_g1_i3:127-663(-)
MFSMVESKVAPTFNIIGVILVTLSLFGDSVCMNMQERILKTYGSAESEMMFWSNLMGAGNTLLWTAVCGELMPAVVFCSSHLWMYPLFVLTGFLGYVGANSIVRVIYLVGPATASVMGSARKVITIVLSFVLFPKAFSIWFLYAGTIFFVGVALNTWAATYYRAMDARVRTEQKVPSV